MDKDLKVKIGLGVGLVVLSYLAYDTLSGPSVPNRGNNRAPIVQEVVKTVEAPAPQKVVINAPLLSMYDQEVLEIYRENSIYDAKISSQKLKNELTELESVGLVADVDGVEAPMPQAIPSRIQNSNFDELERQFQEREQSLSIADRAAREDLALEREKFEEERLKYEMQQRAIMNRAFESVSLVSLSEGPHGLRAWVRVDEQSVKASPGLTIGQFKVVTVDNEAVVMVHMPTGQERTLYPGGYVSPPQVISEDITMEGAEGPASHSVADITRYVQESMQ
ncbi:hypothetical protein [Vibrio barjaei]|uniref:hypothetical protein n=1 Tax=Vibrio barjaei TaxID=1676683 RepID=UPI0022833F1B|nr:hypothetical protein [Vibrio barjaei]MCY9872984.1 hypothetical protein [Vibrio barjaei]